MAYGVFVRDIRKRSSRLFPELERFETSEAAKSALNAAWRGVVGGWHFWAFGFFFLLGAPACLGLLIAHFGHWVGVPRFMTGPIVGGVMGGSVAATFGWAFRQPIRRRLRVRLVELGVPICIDCGYDLRGLTEARCPECGRSFAARLLTPNGG